MQIYDPHQIQLDPHQVQRKDRKEVETRWANQVKFLGSNGVDMILRNLEEMKEAGHLEMMKEKLDEEEKDRVREAKERSEKMRRKKLMPQEERILSW